MKRQCTHTRTASANTTTAPITPGDGGANLPEFGRCDDVRKLFGLKRGYTYQLINAGKIKSVCLRKPGAKTGCRLIHLQSVRDFLLKQLDDGNGGKVGTA